MYISRERKESSIKGTGIQYIPGHDENFVDFVIENYLPESGNILDLGGGGLRFAIPVALKGKTVTVVDIDIESLDVTNIIERVNKNEKMKLKLQSVKGFIQTRLQNMFDFLDETDNNYSFVSAFRVIHFLSPDMLSKFLCLVHRNLDLNGIFVLSAITPYNFLNVNEFNEIYLNSTPITENILYRKFNSTLEAKNIKKQQNLPDYLHLIDNKFVDSLSKRHGFEVIESGLQSTRIVGGYILRKSSDYL
ncbi:Uncharacterised protein [uncultured archaeon]|nr:Uncharacterised protein [uncultured archaeon]